MALIKLAILGGGPSAFYVASRLLQLLPPGHAHASSLRIHIYDRLWAPHGLVRYGVAPDHPEVKNCIHKFDGAAQDPRLTFFGNVNVGSTPSTIPHTLNTSLETFFPHYSHLLMASGCTVPRLHPVLPPSEACTPALSLVHWYTRHPSIPAPPALEKMSHVTLVGHGNVSLDIARILLTEPSLLSQYDVPQPVLEKLAHSNVKHVSIVGRRGPLEASFTNKELREMMNLSQASMIPLDKSVLAPPPDAPITRQQSRTLTLLQQGSKNTPGSVPKSWSLDFFRSPTGQAQSHLALAHTTLDADHRAVPTGATSSLATDFIVTSLGYRAEPFQTWYEPALGHVRNVEGRVVDAGGRTLRNVYASGWAATGAKGVLASTMLNAHTVADAILADHFPRAGNMAVGPVSPPTSMALEDVAPMDVLNPNPHPEDPPPEIREGRRAGVITDYCDWKAIDAEEVRRGQRVGKERERMGWHDARNFLAQR